MAVVTYHNGFTAQSSRNVNNYTPAGQMIIEVWTNPVSFSSIRERRLYLSGGNTEHCLTAEIDNVNGDKMLVYFYDDQPSNIPNSTQTIPTDAELIDMLENYG